jgi:hypothetical protein
MSELAVLNWPCWPCGACAAGQELARFLAGAGAHIMELICDCIAGLAIAASICFIWAAI